MDFFQLSVPSFLILTLCLQETVGVKWRGRSLLFIDEEIDSNHYTSKSQSKQVEEVTCILWILSNFQLFVPSGSVEFYQELKTSECTLIIIHPKQAKNTWVQSYD